MCMNTSFHRRLLVDVRFPTTRLLFFRAGPSSSHSSYTACWWQRLTNLTMSQDLNIWMPQEEMTLMDLRVCIDRIIRHQGRLSFGGVRKLKPLKATAVGPDHPEHEVFFPTSQSLNRPTSLFFFFFVSFTYLLYVFECSMTLCLKKA